MSLGTPAPCLCRRLVKCAVIIIVKCAVSPKLRSSPKLVRLRSAIYGWVVREITFRCRFLAGIWPKGPREVRECHAKSVCEREERVCAWWGRTHGIMQSTNGCYKGCKHGIMQSTNGCYKGCKHGIMQSTNRMLQRYHAVREQDVTKVANIHAYTFAVGHNQGPMHRAVEGRKDSRFSI